MIQYNKTEPRDSLRELFDQIEIIEVPGEDTPLSVRLLPDARHYLVFYCGNSFTYKLCGINIKYNEHLFFSGITPFYGSGNIKGSLSMISFRVVPCGMKKFSIQSAASFANKFISFRKLVDIDTTKLIENLFSTDDNMKRVDLIENFIEQIPMNKTTPCDNNFLDIINTISQHKGIVNISDLLSQYAISDTYLERLFKYYIGISPKQYCKLLKIKFIFETAKANPTINFTKLAYDTGYFDQSHFIKDFRKITGLNPKSYYSAKRMFGDSFALEE